MGKRNRNATVTTDTSEQVTTDTIEVVVEQAPETERAEYEALQARKQELLAELGTIEGTLQAQYRNWYLLSSVVARPVALCREVFLGQALVVGGVPQRKVVLDLCTSKGISPNTAKTQYQVNKGRYERGEFNEQIFNEANYPELEPFEG